MTANKDSGYNINKIYDCSPITKCSRFTKLHYLLRYQQKTKQECADYEFELTKELTNDINSRNENQWTPLMLAARNGYVKMVRRLLSAGADPNLQEILGWTALLLAASVSKTDSSNEIVQLLLEHGANPNLQNKMGTSALSFAIKSLNKESTIETVKLLLEYKADPNLQNIYGKTILDYCFESSIIELLLKLNIKIISAADLNILKNYNMLYERELIINEQNEKIKLLENKIELLENKINDLSFLPPDVGGNQYISVENNFNKN